MILMFWLTDSKSLEHSPFRVCCIQITITLAKLVLFLIGVWYCYVKVWNLPKPFLVKKKYFHLYIILLYSFDH